LTWIIFSKVYIFVYWTSKSKWYVLFSQFSGCWLILCLHQSFFMHSLVTTKYKLLISNNLSITFVLIQKQNGHCSADFTIPNNRVHQPFIMHYFNVIYKNVHWMSSKWPALGHLHFWQLICSHQPFIMSISSLRFL
jgi:hypothetical protein